MTLWHTMQMLLRAQEAVTAVWATSVGLSVPETQIVLLLRQHRPLRGNAELAACLGVSRQAVQRTARAMSERGLLDPVKRDVAGRIEFWRLTSAGQEIASALDALVNEWVKMLSDVVDVERLDEELGWIFTQLIDWSPVVKSWRRAVRLPYALRPNPTAELTALREARLKGTNTAAQVDEPRDHERRTSEVGAASEDGREGDGGLQH